MISLREKAEELGIALTDRQLAQFEIYYELLTEKNKVMNLTAITEREDVILKHFVDSLALVKAECVDFLHKKFSMWGQERDFREFL